MHTEISTKRLEWLTHNALGGGYSETRCGQYYTYKEGGHWFAGRVMFGRDVNFRIQFPTIASAKDYLQQYESEKVIFVGDPIEEVTA